MKKNSSMIHGNLMYSIIVFALPLLGSSIVQQLYNTADLLFVSNFAGKTGAAAVGASGLIFTCLIGICTGLAVGINILVSRKVGEGDLKEAKHISQTAILLAIIIGIVLTAVGIIFARPILRCMQTPGSIMEEALTYLRTYMMSMTFMVIYNMGSSVLRSYGNSRTPFYILLLGGCLNVFADFLFVAVFRMGVLGAALATTICQGVCAAVILVYLFKGNNEVCLRGEGRRPSGLLIKQIIRMSLPIAVQSMVITFSNIIVQSHINSYGEDTIAAFAAYFRIECFIYLPLVSVGQAMTTFVGQNYGARSLSRIKKGTLYSAFLCAAVALVIGLVFTVFQRQVYSLFLKDENVIEIGRNIVMVTFPLYWIYGILEVFSGSMKGLGRTITSMAITFGVLCAGRVGILILMQGLFHTVSAVAAVYPITWGGAALLFLIMFWINMHKLSKTISRG